ncbi:MAG: hypothetical protein AB7G47_15575 [Mycolicibacterium sp.]|uniref:hypothetical protein n=1 Tax=Mycolicibacterium sp. TaxID=2320850 RepID=UPI003D121406
MKSFVLVTGPPSAGVSSVARVLRDRIAGRIVVEQQDTVRGNLGDLGDTAGGAVPAAVVFVVSAVAPITESDCALAEVAASRTDVVVLVLSKIDDHRAWRNVLALNRLRLAAFAERFAGAPWIAAAAAPRLGAPNVDDLVDHLVDRLDDPEAVRRNELRAAEFRLRTAISRLDAVVAEHRERADTLREQREELVRQRMVLSAEAGMALRSRIQHARVTLAFSARNRCAAVRTELLAEAAGPGRRPIAGFEDRVLRRCRALITEIDEEIAARMGAVSKDLNLPAPGLPPAARIAGLTDGPVGSGRLETRLMAVLGAGFGLGVALMVARLFAGLAPQATILGLAVGGTAGLTLTAWVVKSRGLLQYRAMLDRWVNETVGTVRAVAEQRVASGVLFAEVALSPAYLAGVAAQREAVARGIAATDAQLRRQQRVTAGAEADRERETASLLGELRAVRDALAERWPIEPERADEG